jgi:hypothetical protein
MYPPVKVTVADMGPASPVPLLYIAIVAAVSGIRTTFLFGKRTPPEYPADIALGPSERVFVFGLNIISIGI